MKIKFTKDFANNWKVGDIVEIKYLEQLEQGEVLVDDVAIINLELLLKHCVIIQESEERKSMIEDRLIVGNNGIPVTLDFVDPIIRKRTPLAVADAVIRECEDDRRWLKDVIYFIQTYIDRTYTSDIVAENEDKE